MKTKETQSRAQFQTGFEKAWKCIAWLLIAAIVIFGGILYYLIVSNVLPSFILLVLTCAILASGWLVSLEFEHLIKLKDIIQRMEDENKSWTKRIEYLEDLRKLSLEEIHKMRNFIDEEKVKAEHLTATEEIAICKLNVTITKQKIVYLMGVRPFWKYFLRLQWLRKSM